MTAVVDVKLDDVLDRKHLPPLGALSLLSSLVVRTLTRLDQASKISRNGFSSSSKTRKISISSSGLKSIMLDTPNG